MTACEDGATAISKSAVFGSTVMVRVGGLGSEFPVASMTVNDVTYVPGVSKVIAPGTCAVDELGQPPGKIQEYFAAVVAVLNDTDPPAVMVTSDVGEAIVARGGAVV